MEADHKLDSNFSQAFLVVADWNRATNHSTPGSSTSGWFTSTSWFQKISRSWFWLEWFHLKHIWFQLIHSNRVSVQSISVANWINILSSISTRYFNRHHHHYACKWNYLVMKSRLSQATPIFHKQFRPPAFPHAPEMYSYRIGICKLSCFSFVYQKILLCM